MPCPRQEPISQGRSWPCPKLRGTILDCSLVCCIFILLFCDNARSGRVHNFRSSTELGCLILVALAPPGLCGSCAQPHAVVLSRFLRNVACNMLCSWLCISPKRLVFQNTRSAKTWWSCFMLEISCSVACLPAKLQRDRKITPSWCVAELFGLALQSFVGESRNHLSDQTHRGSILVLLAGSRTIIIGNAISKSFLLELCCIRLNGLVM